MLCIIETVHGRFFDQTMCLQDDFLNLTSSAFFIQVSKLIVQDLDAFGQDYLVYTSAVVKNWNGFDNCIFSELEELLLEILN